MLRYSLAAFMGAVIVLAFAVGGSHFATVQADEKAGAEKVLRHVVLFKFNEDAAQDAIADVEKTFAALPEEIDEIKDLEWGTDVSPGDKAKGFTHCFIVTFDDQEGLAAYGPHPAHQELIGKLGPVLDDVLVVDYWSE